MKPLSAGPTPTPLDAHAEVTAYEPDRVAVLARTNRPALLVLADNMYEGWEATVGGEPTEILRTNHTFRGVLLPAGEHTVEFVFRPRALYSGLYISLGAFLLLLAYGLLLLRRARRRESPDPA